MRDLIDIVESADKPGPEISREDAEAILSDPRCKRGVKIGASVRLWRGESDEPGSGMASYGGGLYFTADRKYAAKFGTVREIPRYELPDNPLRFDTRNDFEIWLQTAQKRLGYAGNRELGEAYYDFSYFIRALDPTIDGIQIYTGKDAIFVVYPPIE